MTTIPTHNHVIQQSGKAQDTIQHAKAHQLPEHLAADQAKREANQQTTVQVADNSGRVSADGEKEKQAGKKRRKKQEKKTEKLKKTQIPDVPGYLLDTVV